jgi:hypothetical protein
MEMVRIRCIMSIIYIGICSVIYHGENGRLTPCTALPLEVTLEIEGNAILWRIVIRTISTIWPGGMEMKPASERSCG